MISDSRLTALEVIGIAIKSEIEAAELYARMQGQVRNASLAAKLDFLRREEEKHRVMLEELYVKRFPDVDLQLPVQSVIPRLDQASRGSLTMPDLFELAMEAERLAAGFYLKEAGHSRDEVSRTILRYLGNIEQGHLQMLQTEYELVSRFPDYYDADEFHIGDQMMHVGP